MEGQGTRGAIVLSWRQSPQQDGEQIQVQLARSLRYFEQLEREGDISQYRVYQDLNGARNTAVLEGQLDRLIDLPRRVQHRNFLLACQLTLPEFNSTTSIGGSNGDAEEVLRLVTQVQNQIQGQTRQQSQQTQQSQQDREFEGQQRQQRQQGEQGGEFATVGVGQHSERSNQGQQGWPSERN